MILIPPKITFFSHQNFRGFPIPYVCSPYWMRAGTGEIFSMWLAQDGRKVADIPKEELDKAKAISQVGGALYEAVEYASGLVPGLKQTGVSWGDVVMKKLLKEAWDTRSETSWAIR